MKFSSIFFFASMALAAPSMQKVEPRQQTVASTVLSSVNTLQAATTTNLNSINRALVAIRQSTDATLQIELEATIRANYEAILEALLTATTSITSVTTDAAGGITGSLRGLTQQQLDQVAAAVRSTVTALQNIRAAVTVEITNLGPSTQDLILEETNALKQAVGPFLTPLLRYFNAVRAFGARIGLSVSGLDTALQSLSNTIQGLLNSLGLTLMV